MDVNNEGKVYIMNQKTKDGLVERLYSQVMKEKRNLVTYMRIIGNMDIIVDNRLGNDVIEVYNREMYDGLMERDKYTDE